nr:MAG TPA: hypothetical protein [Caudoviricetes sp.]
MLYHLFCLFLSLLPCFVSFLDFLHYSKSPPSFLQQKYRAIKAYLSLNARYV